MPDVQPLHAAMAAQCIGEAIEAVAHDFIDALNTGRGKGFDMIFSLDWVDGFNGCRQKGSPRPEVRCSGRG